MNSFRAMWMVVLGGCGLANAQEASAGAREGGRASAAPTLVPEGKRIAKPKGAAALRAPEPAPDAARTADTAELEELLGRLVGNGLDPAQLESLVRQYARLRPDAARPDAAGASDASRSVTVRHSARFKVVKDGKVIEESSELARDLDRTLSRLLSPGLEVEGFDALLGDLVGELVDGEIEGQLRTRSSVRKGVTVHGAPVDAKFGGRSGAQALREFERRCPELKGDLERLLREVDLGCAKRRRERTEAIRPGGGAVKNRPATRAVDVR
jgi:hypothetical protein